MASELAFCCHLKGAREMLELSREVCIELLAAHNFGRLAVVLPSGLPVIGPVNYVFDPRTQSVVLRTGRGSKFTHC